MTDIRITLTPAERKRAQQLIRRTAEFGADATLDYLGRFRPDAYPALVAYLAALACNVAGLEPRDVMRNRHDQPLLHNEKERRECHRLYAHHGVRTPEVVVGEREYQRIQARKRAQRQKMSAA